MTKFAEQETGRIAVARKPSKLENKFWAYLFLGNGTTRCLSRSLAQKCPPN